MLRRTFFRIIGSTPLLFGMNNLNALQQYAESLSPAERMPILFLGHGSPMNAIEENAFVRGFRRIARTITTTPKAILCISAHWYTRGTRVTAMDMPRTIHDFTGFPKALYDVTYPAKGDPALAQETKDLLPHAGVELDQQWGLDHGAWSVIKHLYPAAEIPVIQLSIDFTKTPDEHFELGKALSALRDKGILIIGSGNIVHNLSMMDFRGMNREDYGYDWAREARDVINAWLLDGNYAPLLNYKQENQVLQLAIPTPEHFLPLIYILALQKKGEHMELFNDKMVGGSISMTSLRIA